MHPATLEVLDYLASSAPVLDSAVAAVRAENRDRRPAPDRWSVAEILEHLSVVETSVGRLLDQNVNAARAAGLGAERIATPIVTTVPIDRLLDREARLTAGERSRPKGELGWADARAALDTARSRVIEIVRAADGLALSEIVLPHPVLGPLNVYQWIVFLGAHTMRHAAQIRETAS